MGGNDFNARRLRGALAERQIKQVELARASRLCRNSVNNVLTERLSPGELTRYKLRDGLQKLGIDPAIAFGPGEQPTEPMQQPEP